MVLCRIFILFYFQPIGGISLISHLDMRLPSSKAAAQQRSINLAISHRGIAALEAVEPALATRFLQSAIPMRGRMIHKQTEELNSQLYDRHGQVQVFDSVIACVY